MDPNGFSCELITKPALHLMEARFPVRLVNAVNTYIDGVRESAADHSRALVGQIKQDQRSAQLQLDLGQHIPSKLGSEILTVAEQYIKMLGHRATITGNDMWSVHSYSGDYNPLHDHGGNTPLGLASILYLKVPPIIAEKPAVSHGGAPRLNMSSGNCDGYTQLMWGATGMRDFTLLRPPSQQYIKPEEGKLIIFPNWLLHRVEPFFGDGERRTLSFNMDVKFHEPAWY